jgi:hypothetical protein
MPTIMVFGDTRNYMSGGSLTTMITKHDDDTTVKHTMTQYVVDDPVEFLKAINDIIKVAFPLDYVSECLVNVDGVLKSVIAK